MVDDNERPDDQKGFSGEPGMPYGCSVVTNATVTSPGVANSFPIASHITRTRRAHQVTAASVHLVMKKAYEEYSKTKEIDGPAKPFDEWREKKMKKCPQFLY